MALKKCRPNRPPWFWNLGWWRLVKIWWPPKMSPKICTRGRRAKGVGTSHGTSNRPPPQNLGDPMSHPKNPNHLWVSPWKGSVWGTDINRSLTISRTESAGRTWKGHSLRTKLKWSTQILLRLRTRMADYGEKSEKVLSLVISLMRNYNEFR